MNKVKLEEIKKIINGPHNKAPLGLKRLINRMIFNWPIENVNNNYREITKNINETYYKWLLELDEESINYIFPETIRDKIFSKIREYIDTIDDIIKLRISGLTRKAYNLFNNMMSDNKGDMLALLRRKLDNGENFLYRMRKISPHRGVTRKDLFHIPLDARHLVNTYRFSHPGYPCLYLGTSINVCWEELLRPDLSEFMIVKVAQMVGGVKVIDLSLPSNIDKLFMFDIWKFIMSYPFIVACGIKVCNPCEKKYKEEYIIPQMLTEYIIENNHKALEGEIVENITAIKYTSTHYNKDFCNNLEKFTNIAIPVIDIKTKEKYCPHLKRLYLLTEPTCFSYEMKRGNLSDNTKETLWERMENILRSRSVNFIDE